jgi:chromosome segregation ATPase
MNERVELEEGRHEIERLKRKVQELEARSEEAVAASESAVAMAAGVHLTEMQRREEVVQEMKRRWEEERASWNLEKATLMGDMNEQVVKLQQDAASGSGSKAQLDDFVEGLSSLTQAHGIRVAAGAPPAFLVAALSSHLGDLRSRMDEHTWAQEEWTARSAQLEEDMRSLSAKNQELTQQLDGVMRERDEARVGVHNLELQLQVCPVRYKLRLVLKDQFSDSSSSISRCDRCSQPTSGAI